MTTESQDQERRLAEEFEETDAFELPPDEEWDSYNLTDVSQGNRAVRLLRRMLRNRREVTDLAAVEYARLDRVYQGKRAEIDQFVLDRLGRQDKAEPWLMGQLKSLANRELDERLAENPRASKTVHFVGAHVSSRKVGGQPEVIDHDEWFPWAVDHEEVDRESKCWLPYEVLVLIDQHLGDLDATLVADIDRARAARAEERVIYAMDLRRRHIEDLREQIAVAEAAGAKPHFKQWEERYRWVEGTPELRDADYGNVVEAGVPSAWYPIGTLEVLPVPGVGRREVGRNLTLVIDEEG